jgi:hypothetical protein
MRSFNNQCAYRGYLVSRKKVEFYCFGKPRSEDVRCQITSDRMPVQMLFGAVTRLIQNDSYDLKGTV